MCNLYCNIYVIISVNYTVSIFISLFSDTCSMTLYSRLSSSFLVMRIFTPLLSYISLKHKIIRFIHSGTSITSSVFFYTPFITLSFSLFLSPPRPRIVTTRHTLSMCSTLHITAPPLNNKISKRWIRWG